MIHDKLDLWHIDREYLHNTKPRGSTPFNISSTYSKPCGSQFALENCHVFITWFGIEKVHQSEFAKSLLDYVSKMCPQKHTIHWFQERTHSQHWTYDVVSYNSKNSTLPNSRITSFEFFAEWVVDVTQLQIGMKCFSAKMIFDLFHKLLNSESASFTTACDNPNTLLFLWSTCAGLNKTNLTDSGWPSSTCANVNTQKLSEPWSTYGSGLDSLDLFPAYNEITIQFFRPIFLKEDSAVLEITHIPSGAFSLTTVCVSVRIFSSRHQCWICGM